MRKYIQKGISMALIMSMATWSMVGCGSNSTSTTKKTTANEDTSKATSQMESLLTSKVGNNEKADKKETVFVEMKADGTVSKTTVSDVLSSTDKDNISDVSKLNNITNLSGEEKFAIGSNGKIVWQNKGQDIKYQGTTKQSLPVSVKIKYYLDGTETTPEDILGKSGKVKIVYEYTNNSDSNNGNFTPFLMLTGFVLNSDFKNIEIDNGKVVEYDGNNIVIGYGAPGVKDYLLDTVKNADDYIGDIDIPESVTVTADVTNFQMDMGITVASSELGDVNLKDSLDFSDLESQMKDLQEGTDTLVNGTKTLNDGTGKLKSGSGQLSSGLVSLASGTGELSKGAGTLYNKYTLFNKALVSGIASANDGADKLYKGSTDLKSATAKLDDGAKKIDSGATTLNKGSKDLDDAAGKIKTGAKDLADGVETAKAGSKSVKDGASQIQAGFEDQEKTQGAVSGSKALASGAKDANAGVKKIVEMLQDTPSSMDDQITKILDKVSAATGGAISSKAALNATVEGINSAVKQGMDLSKVLTSKGLNATAYYSLVEAYYSIKTLETVQSTFETQIANNASDIKKLLEGMDTLETGAANLSSGIAKLYAGSKQLAEGSTTLYEGLEKLNTGATTLSSGTSQLKDGTAKVKDGANTLKSGTSTLSDGTGKLKVGATTLSSGIKTLKDGTTTMVTKIGGASSQLKTGISDIYQATVKVNNGAGKLESGSKTLDEGIITLASGTKTLKDGAIKLNNEGISKITSIFGDDAKDAVDQIEDMFDAGKDYKSFSGISSDMSGSVKFIFKTDEIKSDK